MMERRGGHGRTMWFKYVAVSALALRLLTGQTRNAGEPNEGDLREALVRWSRGPEGGGMDRQDNRATVFAIRHEDVAIPMLLDAIKAKLRDKQTMNDKRTQHFIHGVVHLATYNAGQRAVDAAAEVCVLDERLCASVIDTLLDNGAAQRHPLITAYEAVGRYPNLRTFVLP